MKLKQCISVFLLSISIWFPLNQALAQTFPDHPVRLVVPYPAGGPVDFVARSVAPEISKVWNQPVVIDNISGASGMIGSAAVSRAKADGYTLLLGGVQTHAMNSGVFRNMPYHPVKDFTPIIQITNVPWVIVANATLGIKTMEEMIAAMKARPNHYSYASSGMGSGAHLTFASLLKLVGAEALHVPYKGAAQGLQDVIAGQVNFTMADLNSVIPQIRSGKLIAIAAASKERLEDFPDLPTIAEKAVPGFVMQPWHVIYGPPNMDPIASSPSALRSACPTR